MKVRALHQSEHHDTACCRQSGNLQTVQQERKLLLLFVCHFFVTWRLRKERQPNQRTSQNSLLKHWNLALIVGGAAAGPTGSTDYG
jgi:hypothetical protein